MDENTSRTTIHTFANFRLDITSERLYKDDELIRIEPQLYALLRLFVTHPSQLITKQTIEDEVWNRRPVTDDALRAALKKLRDLLGDDARSPIFIKTIPKQGYRWLPPVFTQEPVPRPPQKHVKKAMIPGLKWGLFATLSVVLLLAVIAIFVPTSQSSLPTLPIAQIKSVTQLTGSEVDASYNAKKNLLAFIHRSARNSPQQLYLKSLNTGVVTRLSWDQANYKDSYWSWDGQKLVFMRLIDQRDTLHIAHFNPVGEIEQLETLEAEGLQDKYAIGWLEDDSGLILAENMRPNKQHRIFAFNFSTGEVTPLTNPNVAGRGDYKASLSPKNDLLAILREEVSQEASLLITSLGTGNLVAKAVLPFVPNRLVWTPSGGTVAMSNFYGDHIRFDLESGSLSAIPKLPENSLDLFAACDEQCYFLRQHNGNFLDLQETPLASLQSLASPDNGVPILNSGRLLRRAGAQDFPQYIGDDGDLLFVTLENRMLTFQRFARQNQLQDVAYMDATLPLSAVVVAPNGEQLVGMSAGRMFRASLTNPAAIDVEFVTNALEQFANPIWHPNSGHVFVAQKTANQAAIVKYHLATNTASPIIDGLIAFALLPGQDERAVGITPNHQLVLLGHQEGQWQQIRTLGQVTSANPNRWKVTPTGIFHTKYQMPEAFLCHISLTEMSGTPAEQCWSIGDNRFRLHFDIDAALKKVMLVESLSAESDVIKMQW